MAKSIRQWAEETAASIFSRKAGTFSDAVNNYEAQYGAGSYQYTNEEEAIVQIEAQLTLLEEFRSQGAINDEQYYQMLGGITGTEGSSSETSDYR